MKLASLTQLNAQLDQTLNEFGLTANAAGQYPWQEAQEKRRNRRIVAGATGAAAIGAGAYGAKKGIDALKGRYGVSSAKDALTVGASEGVQKLRGAVVPMVDKLKAAAGGAVKAAAGNPVMRPQGAPNPVVAAVKRKWSAGKAAVTRGMAQKQGVGAVLKRAGRALVRAEVGGGMPPIVALEAQLDKVLGL